VVTEVAMAVVILVAAGLVTKSLSRLGSVDAGMNVEGLLTFRATPPSLTYPTTAELTPLMDRLEGQLGALPGVSSAGAITDLPMSGAVNSVTALRDDRPPPAPGEGLLVLMRAVTPGYFRTAGIVIQRGRDVTGADRMDAEMVVVVNDALARQLFTGENPVGARMTSMGVSRLIVGVVQDVREMGPGQASEPAAYIPYGQIRGAEWMRRSVTFMVRANGDPSGLTGAVRGVVRSVDPRIPVNDVQPMTSVLSASIAAPRFRSLVFGLFGVLALTLAAVGIGGLMTFNLSQRHREIAIRLAIGADPGMVTRLVVAQGVRLTAVGAAIGLAAALLVSRVMAGVLFEVNPRDPAVFAAVTALLTAIGVLATYLPARRASRVAPATLLKSE
jgi:predicted permease